MAHFFSVRSCLILREYQGEDLLNTPTWHDKNIMKCFFSVSGLSEATTGVEEQANFENWSPNPSRVLNENHGMQRCT